MTAFFQAAVAVLVAVILILALRSQGKDMGTLLSIFVCCCLGAVAIGYLSPVIGLLEQIREMAALDTEMFTYLLKVVGVALVGEIASLVCGDAGNAAMGKALQVVTAAVILWLSTPMLSALLELVSSILRNV